MSLARAVATVGGLTLLSRVTGFVRDMLIARYLGAGLVADAFFVAFKVPNLFRHLFAEGAFSAAFVPAFARALQGEGAEAARRFARTVLTVLVLAVTAFVIAMEVAMPWAMEVLAPGFDAVPGKQELATELSRIAFPYLALVSVAALMTGVLNALNRFAAGAAAPILTNICMMVGLLAAGTALETPAHALVWAILVAGLLQVVWLSYECARRGMALAPTRPSLPPRVRAMLGRVVPGAIGAGVYQINVLVDTLLATLLGTGAVSFLYYADRLNQLPLGVIGIAIGTALLPALSRALEAGETERAADQQNRAIEIGLLLTVPAAVGLAVLAQPIVQVLFERGAFTAEATAATAAALRAFALGLPAYVLIKVLAPGFFAREDTATPVRVAGFAFLINLSLNLILMGPLGHVGLALATALAAWVNAATLALLLARRGGLIIDARLKRRLPRILLAAALMGLSLWPLLSLYQPAAAWPALARGLALAGLIGAGAAVFAIAVLLLKAASLDDLRRLRRRGEAAPPPSAIDPG